MKYPVTVTDPELNKDTMYIQISFRFIISKYSLRKVVLEVQDVSSSPRFVHKIPAEINI